jgi:predicted DNA-binding protein (UPF0278 family)
MGLVQKLREKAEIYRELARKGLLSDEDIEFLRELGVEV